jgi:hypothetical protein
MAKRKERHGIPDKLLDPMIVGYVERMTSWARTAAEATDWSARRASSRGGDESRMRRMDATAAIRAMRRAEDASRTRARFRSKFRAIATARSSRRSFGCTSADSKASTRRSCRCTRGESACARSKRACRRSTGPRSPDLISQVTDTVVDESRSGCACSTHLADRLPRRARRQSARPRRRHKQVGVRRAWRWRRRKQRTLRRLARIDRRCEVLTEGHHGAQKPRRRRHLDRPDA